MTRTVWVVWERQRRSVTLASLLADEYAEFDECGGRVRRYLRSLFRTLRVLVRHRGGVVVVQNPSMVLAFLAALLKPVLRYRLVVDRHTDAHMLGRGRGVVMAVLRGMSRFTLRHADLTIVTNQELVPKVEEAGGRAFILPDPLPDLSAYLDTPVEPAPSFSIFCVASWSADEPLDAYIEAARRLPDVRFLISGKPRGAHLVLLRDLPPNVECTGYLSDRDYYRTMAACQGVIAFSSQPATLVCGGYEAVRLGKPFITGDSAVLRDYFQPALYASGTATDLAAKVAELKAHQQALTEEVEQFRQQAVPAWEQQFRELQRLLRRDAAGAEVLIRSK